MTLADDLAPGATGLDQLRAMIAAGGVAAIGTTLGFHLVEAGDGTAVFASTPGRHVYNPIGTVHGGYAATLLDSACGCAVHLLDEQRAPREEAPARHRLASSDVVIRSGHDEVVLGSRAVDGVQAQLVVESLPNSPCRGGRAGRAISVFDPGADHRLQPRDVLLSERFQRGSKGGVDLQVARKSEHASGHVECRRDDIALCLGRRRRAGLSLDRRRREQGGAQHRLDAQPAEPGRDFDAEESTLIHDNSYFSTNARSIT